MKQKLRFQSEQEFQSFFGQLTSVEIPDFQAVEGSGGDMGFDGISETAVFQAYFPDEKNRTDSKYIAKIDKDLKKVLASAKKLGLIITKWILVAPEDLRMPVVSHLVNKSRETGISCSYWGATKLTGLVSKHPHIQESFPTIFLPPVNERVKEIQESLNSGIRATLIKSESPTKILPDTEFARLRREIEQDLSSKVRPYYEAGRPSRVYLDKIVELEKEAEQKHTDLQIRKHASDSLYTLEIEEIEERYNEEVEKVNEEMNQRGIFFSGIKDRETGKLKVKKKREIERLKLKYGKTGLITTLDS